MSEDGRPRGVHRSTSGSFISVDASRLAEWVGDTFGRSGQYFSQPANTLEWIADFREGAVRGKGELEQIDKIRESLKKTPAEFVAVIYPQIHTQGPLRLALLPEER